VTELFPVEVTAPNLPIAGDRPVVFHGVNKSGSLAMANVMRDAYDAAGRSDEFVSHYHDRPQDFDEFAQAVQHAEGHAFFVAHYVYKRVAVPPKALLVSQVRHPLPRALSVYGWLKRNRLKRYGTLDGFPDLRAWAISTKGKRQTQMAQFAVGFEDGWQPKLEAMPPHDVCATALENLQRDFFWFGLAELFEESIFTLAHVSGLVVVPAWAKDTRNRWRQSLASTNDDTLAFIREVFAYEFQFYECAVQLFEERLATVDFGPSFYAYKDRCRSEYGERLLSSWPAT
jgi:hypothetical protein